MTISAVFLDRDGILNEYLPGDYVRRPDDLRLIPGVAAAVKRLNAAGLPVIVVSNQQGVGKGLMSRADLEDVERSLCARLNDETGARLDKCFYCTELSSAKSPRRKPEPGMLLEAAEEFGLNPHEMVMVGDSPTDIAAGKAAGVASAILVLSGSIREYSKGDMTPAPDYVFPDLGAAVDWILERGQTRPSKAMGTAPE